MLLMKGFCKVAKNDGTIFKIRFNEPRSIVMKKCDKIDVTIIFKSAKKYNLLFENSKSTKICKVSKYNVVKVFF